MFDKPKEFELKILYKINSLDSKYAKIFFKVMGYFGHFIFWFLICGFFILLGLQTSNLLIRIGWGLETFNFATLLGIGLGIDALASNALQYLFNRKRPFKTLDLTKLHVHSYELTPSFPSAHVHRAFFTVTLMIWGGIELAFFLYIFSCIVGISRLYLGVHYTLDVIFGGIFGILISTIFYLLSPSFISWVAIEIALLATELSFFELFLLGTLGLILIIIGFYFYVRLRKQYQKEMKAKYG